MNLSQSRASRRTLIHERRINRYPLSNANSIVIGLPFRGYLKGTAFLTAKGYHGRRLDSLWMKHLIESFDDDDEELCNLAFESVLADLNVSVTGGECGAPYSIAEYGFYTKNQFVFQTKLL